MKKLFIATSILLSGMLITPSTSVAQDIDKEATYEITGKSKRGKLAKVEQSANGDYVLTYLTKSNNKKAKFQIYTFDKDFNFKNLEDGEIEFEKIKTKFSWFEYNGELYSVDAITLNWNPAAPLKLKKKRITYKYDWLLLGYHKTTEVLEKVKPRTDDGNKYFAKGYFEDEITGDLYIIAGEAPGMMSKDAMEQHRNLHILKFDWDLNLVGDIELPFEYDQSLAFAQYFASTDPSNPEAVGIDGGVIVFAPVNMSGGTSKKDPNKNNFTYVEFSKDMKLISRKSFDSPSPGWAIETAIWTENSKGTRDVYLYGSAALGKDKYHQVAVQSGKKKSIQLMKVSDGNVEFITETDIEEMESKKHTAPSVKKTQEYNGRQAVKGGYEFLSNGDLLVMGQFIGKEGMGVDFYGIQFDKSGKLLATYGVGLTEKNPINAPNGYNFINRGSHVYLEVIQAEGTPQLSYLYPALSKIDTDRKSVSDPLVLGLDGKKQKYFVDKSFPRLNISDDQIVYFGSDKKGKNIWFCRVNVK